MVASTVAGSWPPAGLDVPLVRSSFAGLFLGGISWVFRRVREHGGC
jgi:hypothetical protein